MPPSEAELEACGAKGVVLAFKDIVYGVGHEANLEEEAAAAEAAKLSRGGGGAKRKAAPACGPDEEALVAGLDWKDMARTGELNSLTLTQLKGYCTAHGLGVSGRKAALVDRITEHVHKPPATGDL